MMICVIDSSFTASLFLPDEASEKSAALAAKIGRDGATAPGMWQLEIANVLLMAVRRGRITPAERKQAADAIDALPVLLQPVLSVKHRGDMMHLSDKHKLSAYDAAYL